MLIGPSEQRGHGYGKQLMQAALRFAFEELALQKVTLGVFTFNTPAIRCYEKLGFIQERMLKNARKHGEDYWDLIEMAVEKKAGAYYV